MAAQPVWQVEETIPQLHNQPALNEYTGLVRKVKDYKGTLDNTRSYRRAWTEGLRDEIVQYLEHMISATDLGATVTLADNLGNAEAIIISMGKEASGIFARVDADTNKPLIKDNGSLVYQQLFNGKIQVTMFLPFIEGFGQPPEPKMIAIYRPEELKPPYLERHLEEFIRHLTEWEDFDDDQPSQIGFQMSNINLPSKESLK